jgi:hypothetical protein
MRRKKIMNKLLWRERWNEDDIPDALKQPWELIYNPISNDDTLDKEEN